MFDITKHKWSDYLINERDGATPKGDLLEIRHEGDYNNAEAITINEDDTIAIAKHFYESLGLVERVRFLNAISGLVSQSETAYLNSTKANKERLEESIKQLERGETTYKSLNLDSVAEMKDNELFNKGDLHG